MKQQQISFKKSQPITNLAMFYLKDQKLSNIKLFYHLKADNKILSSLNLVPSNQIMGICESEEVQPDQTPEQRQYSELYQYVQDVKRLIKRYKDFGAATEQYLNQNVKRTKEEITRTNERKQISMKRNQNLVRYVSANFTFQKSQEYRNRRYKQLHDKFDKLKMELGFHENVLDHVKDYAGLYSKYEGKLSKSRHAQYLQTYVGMLNQRNKLNERALKRGFESEGVRWMDTGQQYRLELKVCLKQEDNKQEIPCYYGKYYLIEERFLNWVKRNPIR